MISRREILAYLSTIYQGDWKKIYDRILAKDKDPLPSDEEMLKVTSKIKSNYICCLDDEYPKALLSICKAPFVLFYYGDISLLKETEKNLAVVGSRDFSLYGQESTINIVKGLAKEFNIVSGLARGIDRIAHETCINNGGKTIAILGCGIDYCYPPENIDIYEEIKKNHLLISEYPGDMVPDISSFPIRNRLIVGVSKGLLVTEAHMMSGSGISARLAIEENRYLMFVPYRIDDKSLGNLFIKDGAYLVQNDEDVRAIMK